MPEAHIAEVESPYLESSFARRSSTTLLSSPTNRHAHRTHFATFDAKHHHYDDDDDDDALLETSGSMLRHSQSQVHRALKRKESVSLFDATGAATAESDKQLEQSLRSPPPKPRNPRLPAVNVTDEVRYVAPPLVRVQSAVKTTAAPSSSSPSSSSPQQTTAETDDSTTRSNSKPVTSKGKETPQRRYDSQNSKKQPPPQSAESDEGGILLQFGSCFAPLAPQRGVFLDAVSLTAPVVVAGTATLQLDGEGGAPNSFLLVAAAGSSSQRKQSERGRGGEEQDKEDTTIDVVVVGPGAAAASRGDSSTSSPPPHDQEAEAADHDGISPPVCVALSTPLASGLLVDSVGKCALLSLLDGSSLPPEDHQQQQQQGGEGKKNNRSSGNQAGPQKYSATLTEYLQMLEGAQSHHETNKKERAVSKGKKHQSQHSNGSHHTDRSRGEPDASTPPAPPHVALLASAQETLQTWRDERSGSNAQEGNDRDTRSSSSKDKNTQRGGILLVRLPVASKPHPPPPEQQQQQPQRLPMMSGCSVTSDGKRKVCLLGGITEVAAGHHHDGGAGGGTVSFARNPTIVRVDSSGSHLASVQSVLCNSLLTPGLAYHSAVQVGNCITTFGGFLDCQVKPISHVFLPQQQPSSGPHKASAAPEESETNVVMSCCGVECAVGEAHFNCPSEADVMIPRVFQQLEDSSNSSGGGPLSSNSTKENHSRPAVLRCCDAVFQFDIESRSWKQLVCRGTVPPPRARHSAAMCGAYMYLTGGVGARGRPCTDLYALHTAMNLWVQLELSCAPSTVLSLGPNPLMLSTPHGLFWCSRSSGGSDHGTLCSATMLTAAADAKKRVAALEVKYGVVAKKGGGSHQNGEEKAENEETQNGAAAAALSSPKSSKHRSQSNEAFNGTQVVLRHQHEIEEIVDRLYLNSMKREDRHRPATSMGVSSSADGGGEDDPTGEHSPLRNIQRPSSVISQTTERLYEPDRPSKRFAKSMALVDAKQQKLPMVGRRQLTNAELAKSTKRLYEDEIAVREKQREAKLRLLEQKQAEQRQPSSSKGAPPADEVVGRLFVTKEKEAERLEALRNKHLRELDREYHMRQPRKRRSPPRPATPSLFVKLYADESAKEEKCKLYEMYVK